MANAKFRMNHVRIFNTYEPVISLVRDLAPALRGAGYTMEVILSKSEYRPGRSGLSDCLGEVGGRAVFMPSCGAKVGTRFGKVLASISYAVGAGLYSVFSRSATVNVFLTQPPFFFVWARIVRLIRRQPYIVVLMDMYPDALIASGAISGRSAVARWLTRLARVGLEGARTVIVIGRDMKERVTALGIASDKVRCIPNWADETKIFPVEDSINTLRKELNLADHFVVLYSGNMGIGHRFDDILEVARLCMDEPKIRFVFIGGGARRHEIEDFVARHHLRNVTLRDFVDAARLPEAQSLGNIHFVTLRADFEGIMVPSKVYGALAAGRPIIYQGSARAEIARMITEERVGAVVDEGDVTHLYETVLEYVRDPLNGRRQGETALRLAHGKYGKQRALSEYVDVITSPGGMGSGVRKESRGYEG